MAQAKMNDTVAVHYTGSLADGTVFDSSQGREPLEFTIGQGMVIPGFENGILGMCEGDKKQISIGVDEGYGPHREDLLTVIDRKQVPAHMELQPGMNLQVRAPDGGITNVVVSALDDEKVTLDLNHPLAGKDLVFEIQLVKINEA